MRLVGVMGLDPEQVTSVTIGGVDFMSGQEWLDRFIKELEALRDNGATGVNEVDIAEAAKRAAGLE